MARGETPERTRLIAELCAKYPRHGNHTIAKRLYAGHPLLFSSYNAAQCAVRHHRGNRGGESRKFADKKGTRRISGIGTVPPIPKSIDEPWEPFEIDARRTLNIGDTHIPFHNANAIEAALRYGDSFKPDAILLNGDYLDFFELSRFDKKPDVVKVESELAQGRELWLHIRHRFPRAKLYWKLGNHCLRWPSYIYKAAPLLSNVKAVIDGWREPVGVDECNVTIIDDDRPVMLGKLPVLHGHELGKGAGGVNPARTAFLKAQHTVLVNHFHRTSGHGDANIWHDEAMAWSVGCLCGKTPRWLRANKWNWGFACITVRKGGEFDVENMRIGNNFVVRKS